MNQQGRDREEALDTYGYSDDMSPFQVFALCMTRHYADFSQRATRREFCHYLLILIALIIAAAVVDLYVLRNGNAFCVITVSAITLLPTVAVFARRTHDYGENHDELVRHMGRATVCAIIVAICYVVYLYNNHYNKILLPLSILAGISGGVYLLCVFLELPIYVFRAFLYDSQPGTNPYGPSYKYPNATSAYSTAPPAKKPTYWGHTYWGLLWPGLIILSWFIICLLVAHLVSSYTSS